MPMMSEEYTSLVMSASANARSGGTSDHAPVSSKMKPSMCFPYLRFTRVRSHRVEREADRPPALSSRSIESCARYIDEARADDGRANVVEGFIFAVLGKMLEQHVKKRG